MAAATDWRGSARGTAANYQARALAHRDAVFTSEGLVSNATTAAQWAAAIAAAEELIAALTVDPGDEFMVQLFGSHDGQPDENAQPVITVSVQRRTL